MNFPKYCFFIPISISSQDYVSIGYATIFFLLGSRQRRNLFQDAGQEAKAEQIFKSELRKEILEL